MDPTIFIEMFGFKEGIEYGGYKLEKIESFEINNEVYEFKLFYNKSPYFQNNPEDFYEEHNHLDKHVIHGDDGNLYDAIIECDSFSINDNLVIIKLIGYLFEHIFQF